MAPVEAAEVAAEEEPDSDDELAGVHMEWMSANPDIVISEADAVRVQRIFIANEFDTVDSLRYVALTGRGRPYSARTQTRTQQEAQ
jgi:hypothetical protein